MKLSSSIKFKGDVVNFGVKLSALSRGEIRVGTPGEDEKVFKWENNPTTGKLDIFTEEGDHIGKAPNVQEAKKFLEKEVKAGNLSRLAKYRLSKQVKSGSYKGLKYQIIDTEYGEGEETTFAVFIEDYGTHQMNVDERGDYKTVDRAEKAAKQAIDYMHANPEEYGVEE